MRLVIPAVFFLLCVIAPAHAASDFGTKEEAVAMVHRAQQMFAKDGLEAASKAIDDPSNKEFHDRDLYAYIFTLKGVCVAHGARPALIGKTLFDLKDVDGTYVVREHIDMAEGPGAGWVNYKWPNPITNKIEDKTSYVEKMGNDYFVGVGVYRP